MTFNLFNNLLIGYKWSTRAIPKKRASLTGCECRLLSLPGNYLRTLFYLKTFRSKYFIKTASKTKIKWHSKNSTTHVKKQKLRLNRDWSIIVDEERWDANRGIPKLRCLRLIGILTWDALGIPKLELLCLLDSSHITVSLNLKNFIHTKLNKNSCDKLV